MSDKAIEAAARAILGIEEVPWQEAPNAVRGHCIRQARACVSAYNAAMEAEGFALVPVEPTGAMVDAGCYGWNDMDAEESANRVYTSMIAARPRAEGE